MLRLPRLLSALLALMLATPALAVDSTSTFLQLLLMDTGLHNNDWGVQTNNNLVKIENAISGYTAKSLTGGSYSLTADEARSAVLIFAGSLASNEIITVPSVPKIWIVSNQMTLGGFALSMKTAAGSAVTVPPNSTSTMLYWCDGTNIFPVSDQSNAAAAAVVTANAALARSGGTMTGDLVLSSSSPPNSLSAAPKTYVDTAVSPLLNRAGGTLTGDLVLFGSAPATSASAAPKSYVDSAVAGVSGLPSQTGNNRKVLTTNGSAASWTPFTVTANASVNAGTVTFTNNMSIIGANTGSWTVTLSGLANANYSIMINGSYTSGTLLNPIISSKTSTGFSVSWYNYNVGLTGAPASIVDITIVGGL